MPIATDPPAPLGTLLPHWQPPPPPSAEAGLGGQWCRLLPALAARDADALFAAHAEDAAGAVWTYLPFGPFAAPADYAAWLAQACQAPDERHYTIVDAQGQALGCAAYLRIQPRAGAIEIGNLAFSPRLQRTTAASEALILLIRHAFALGYRRVEWKCNALNAPSRAAAARLGFTFEGIFRQATVIKGRNRDTAWYSIIDREWPALEAAYAAWLDPANFDAAGCQRRRLSALTAAALKAS
ncbi:GNAT family N-acetyltransferase [Chitiniphilus purpureus]|uniref:GNAT family N-acetyltransferase n=1 Tax=Chitiniphilus purpureus TaxID=2981137 RepID=A0ABY6DP84_9NEIS|nr:GNAT family protein [Chitiniphilus sp. CD1]UXY16174.1 GNAT family N-acetyltransferase [Chitiniphilus sp. CD1]